MRDRINHVVSAMDNSGRQDGYGSTSMNTTYWKECRTKLVEVIEMLDVLNQLPQSPEVNLIEFIEEKGLLEEFKYWLSGPLPTPEEQ